MKRRFQFRWSKIIDLKKNVSINKDFYKTLMILKRIFSIIKVFFLIKLNI